jgi:hypothetical protein
VIVFGVVLIVRGWSGRTVTIWRLPVRRPWLSGAAAVCLGVGTVLGVADIAEGVSGGVAGTVSFGLRMVGCALLIVNALLPRRADTRG